jgi:hypothetical protein
MISNVDDEMAGDGRLFEGDVYVARKENGALLATTIDAHRVELTATAALVVRDVIRRLFDQRIRDAVIELTEPDAKLVFCREAVDAVKFHAIDDDVRRDDGQIGIGREERFGRRRDALQTRDDAGCRARSATNDTLRIRGHPAGTLRVLRRIANWHLTRCDGGTLVVRRRVYVENVAHTERHVVCIFIYARAHDAQRNAKKLK